MGDAKRQPTEIPWEIQILTTDYSIEGHIQPDEDIFRWARQYGFTDAFECAPLTSVQVLPTGHLTTPPKSFATWDLAYCTTIVMIIPRDQASLKAAPKDYADYRHPFRAVIYAGPYVIRATVLSDSEDSQMLFVDHKGFVPLRDAEIDCQMPGSPLMGLKAPWLVLNGGSLHGYSLE